MAGTQCVNCIHSKVCVYKSTFVKATEAVHETTVTIDDDSFIRIKDLDFISTPIVLTCKHHYLEPKAQAQLRKEGLV